MYKIRVIPRLMRPAVGLYNAQRIVLLNLNVLFILYQKQTAF